MREIRQTNIFKHDLKKITNRSKNLNKLYEIVEKLVNDIKLEIRHKPHKLIGEYKNKFECHIEPDWLLIYEVTKDLVILYRTGSHADLF